MIYSDKPILIDGGKSHTAAKYSWIPAVLAVIFTLAFRLHDLNGRRRFVTQYYWLWYDAPAISYTMDILAIAAAGIAATAAVVTCFAIRKNEIRIHGDFCAGRAFKTWSLLPWTREFHLYYDEIKSMKIHKRVLDIRTTDGKYRIFVENPQTCHDYIEKQQKQLKSDIDVR